MNELYISTTPWKEFRKELFNKCYRYRKHLSIVFLITIALSVASCFFLNSNYGIKLHYDYISVNNLFPIIIGAASGVYLVIIMNLPNELTYQQYMTKGKYTAVTVNSFITFCLIIFYSLISAFIPYLVSAVIILAGTDNNVIFTDGLIIENALLILLDYLLTLIVIWGMFSIFHKLMFMIKQGLKWTYVYLGSVLSMIIIGLIMIIPLMAVNMNAFTYEQTIAIQFILPCFATLVIFEIVNLIFKRLIAGRNAL